MSEFAEALDRTREGVGEDAPYPVDDHLVSLLRPHGAEADQYRALRGIVEERRGATGSASLVIAIASPGVGDGKTTTTLNLAGAIAQVPAAKVLVVDADLRRPAVADRLGLRPAPRRGLAEALLDSRLSLGDVVRQCARFNLAVVPAGRNPPAPYEALESARFGELLGQARRDYQYVLVDAAPLVAVPDYRAIGKWVDGVILVVGARRTPRRLVEEALRILDPARTIGVVFNGDSRPYGGYYGQAYGEAASPSRGTRLGRAVAISRALFSRGPRR